MMVKEKETQDTPYQSNLTEVNYLLESLGNSLKEPVMKSTARLTILITLAINRRLTFTDLQKITSMGKGSLSNHIEKLQAGKLVRTRTVLSPSRPRMIVEITKEGLDAYNNYIMILKKLMFL